MMKCRICGNDKENRLFHVREMQHCLKESFPYFQCSGCQCIQIGEIPEDIHKYYPSDYYSFNSGQGNEYLEKELGSFKSIQADYLIHGRNTVLGSLFTLGYKSPAVLQWLKNLQLPKEGSFLDIGCGTGHNLKKLYQLGYRNLTGIDPYIRQDYIFSDSFRIHKMDLFDLTDDKRFDCVMMHHSFEHMERQEEVLRKSKNILRPGGKILIRIPVYSKPLFEKYGSNLVSLDAPRHFYVHSPKSLNLLCTRVGLQIIQVHYDADASSFWASEQYQKDICLTAPNSYGISRDQSVFSKKDIKRFRKDIERLNQLGQSDTAAFYISGT